MTARPVLTQAQPARDNVVRTSASTIEVLGLRRWTLAMLNDSLRKYEGVDLYTEGANACAVTLRYRLGFPDAAAIRLPGTTTTAHWLVTLVEPQDSNRVRYRELSLDALGGIPEWADARRIIQADRKLYALISHEILSEGLPQPSAGTERQPVSSVSASDSPSSMSRDIDTSASPSYERRLRAWFRAQKTGNGYALALEALQRDSNMLDRILALNIILPFLDDDRTWTALAQTLIESDGPVRGTGLSLLQRLVASGKRPRDMNAIFPSLHAVLDGTSQVLMPQVIPLILSLNPDQSFAEPLLKNGGRMLLSHAESRFRIVRDPALALLTALRQKNLGRDIEPWRIWVMSLGSEAGTDVP